MLDLNLHKNSIKIENGKRGLDFEQSLVDLFPELTLPDRWSRWTIWRHGEKARLLSTIQNGHAQCWILALFGEKCQWDQMHFRS